MPFFRGAKRPARKSIKARPKRRYQTAMQTLSTRGVGVPRGVFGFPESLTTLIRYNDVYTIQSSSGSAGGQIMRMTSVFDPDFTGSGHQPLYFDQFTPVYDNYVVLGATLNAEFSPLSDDTEITTTGPYTVGLTGNNNTSYSGGSFVLAEQNKSVTAVLGRDKGTSVVKLKMNYSPKSCLGVSPDDDTIQSAVSTNPSKNWFVYAWVSDDNFTSGSVKVRITITYRVRFFNLKNIPSS